MNADHEKAMEAGRLLAESVVPDGKRWARFVCGCTVTNDPTQKDLEQRCDGADCKREAFDAWLLSKRLQDRWVQKHGVWP